MSTDRKIQKGDVVILKSNPNFKMTVNGTSGLNMIECKWIDELGKPQTEMFNRNSLMIEGSNSSNNESLLLG